MLMNGSPPCPGDFFFLSLFPYSFCSRVIPDCLIIQAAATMCQSQRLGAGLASAAGLVSRSVDGGKGRGNCFHLPAAHNGLGHLRIFPLKRSNKKHISAQEDPDWSTGLGAGGIKSGTRHLSE